LIAAVEGVEALSRVRHDSFDALVLDVMMPGVDGLGVCQVLRADGDRTPVLILTARVETPDHSTVYQRIWGYDLGPTPRTSPCTSATCAAGSPLRALRS
jgi:CheY-like chemotaxis protein